MTESLSFAGSYPVGRRLAELETKISRYSAVPHYVLITGERGTGKTTIAKQLHRQGPRAKNTFVNLNCASLTPELLEAELFGYEKGAFTGATAPKAGLFEIADGGTLFLDEIGEIPLPLQSKLLKAVEEKRIRRVGSNSERAVDPRIISATSRNLEQLVAERRFRADLFDRLNVLKLETVPLKFQKEKIKDFLIERLKEELQLIGRKRPLEISEEALRVIEAYDWQGNFRELMNFAARLAVDCFDEKIVNDSNVLAIIGERITERGCRNVDSAERSSKENGTGDQISTPSAASTKIRQSSFPAPRGRSSNLITVTFDSQTDDLAGIYIKAAGIVINHVLAESNGNLRKAARNLGATHTTLTRLLTKFNASLEEGNLAGHSSESQNPLRDAA